MAGHSPRDCLGEQQVPGSCGSSTWSGRGRGRDKREGKERNPQDGGAGGGGVDAGWMAGEECDCMEEGEQVLGRGLGEKVRGPGRVA